MNSQHVVLAPSPWSFWVGACVAAVFLLLALLHVHWAMGGTFASGAAVPERRVAVDGAGAAVLVKAFTPSPGMTIAVAVALAAVAVLVALRIGLLGAAVSHWPLRAAIGIVAMIMIARAVGDFNLVGFFKTVTESEFARMDTWAYSPLCVVLGLGLGVVALS